MNLSMTPSISDTSDAQTTTNRIAKLSAAFKELREHQEPMTYVKPDFAPSLTNALGIRALAIKKLYSKQSTEVLTQYLLGLGYVRGLVISARNVLNTNGKKKYESWVNNAVETLQERFNGLKPYYLDILTKMMSIPFRRSAEKDRREISNTLCRIADLIKQYRYQGEDQRYREYAHTIVRGIETDELPPMIAGLIIMEVTELVDVAIVTNVLTYDEPGLTHEELWRHHDPEGYAEVYPDSRIPIDASPVEKLNIYPSQFGIAQQSIWWGLDDDVDSFITALAGGLLYTYKEIPPQTHSIDSACR
ncbi:hypothetical protein [Leclercia sp. Marseille-Q4284]|uniref:hypothetical protein n=1 Tax=Leclercia sp. Marseille-Q4284 TaxID=2866582 RepID=UPI001CE43D97|nr:hypothetical protein [Leclercia sp. Marseille-Q4284]